jgi:hypothetical protein
MIFEKKKKKLPNSECVLIYPTNLSEAYLIVRRTERDGVKNLYWCSCKVPVILVRFEWNLSFLDRFLKNPQISNFIKLRPVGAELFHADGRTDGHDEAISRFSQFCEGV